MVEIAGFRVGNVELTRVPYFDVALDAGIANLTAAHITALDWATPSWATAEGQVLVGQAIWVIESQDRVIVVDPCGAADSFLRSGPEAIAHQEAALGAVREAGFPLERIDFVVLSHLEGIGMTAVVSHEGIWSPAFPNARVVITKAEIEFLAAGGPAPGLEEFNQLVAQGVVDGVDDAYELTDEVSLELTSVHTPGHALVRIRSQGDHATFLGHLAINPLNFASPCGSGPDRNEPRVAGLLESLAAESAAQESLLIGPLWPFPGAGYAAADRIDPA